MQVLIFLALLVLIVILAPWLLGVFAALFALWGVIVIPIAICSAVALVVGIWWIDYNGNFDRQQRRLDKRIKKITDAANRANSQKD